MKKTVEINCSNIYKKNAKTGGILLLLAIVTGVVSVAFNITLSEQNFLGKVLTNEKSLIISSILIIIMAFSCAGIAIAFFPVLKKYNEALALGSVAFRIAEGILFVVSAIITLSIVSISKMATSMTGTEGASLETIGLAMNASGDLFSSVAASMAFCFGAFIYYYIFYRTKLVPRWLSVWGMIAMVSYLTTVILVIFGVEGFSTIVVLLNLPTLGNELVLGIWLIAKGFEQTT